MSSLKNKKRHIGFEASNDIIFAGIPLLLMAVYMYGMRPLVMALAAVLTAVVCDWLVAAFRGLDYDVTETGSAAIAMVLVLLLPANTSYYIIIVCTACSVVLGKHALGGYNNYPFNPAALGYVIASVSWPDKIFMYPMPFSQLSVFGSNEAVKLVHAPSYTLKMGGLPNISSLNIVLGNYAGPMGTTAVLVIAACGIYLLLRKRTNLYAPLSFLSTVAAIALIFPRVAVANRFDVMRYEIFCGGLIFAAVFMLCDEATMPKNNISRLIYGALLGIFTMVFRYYGSFELGVCFAFLAVNSFSGYIDRVVQRAIYKRGVKIQ